MHINIYYLLCYYVYLEEILGGSPATAHATGRGQGWASCRFEISTSGTVHTMAKRLLPALMNIFPGFLGPPEVSAHIWCVERSAAAMAISRSAMSPPADCGHIRLLNMNAPRRRFCDSLRLVAPHSLSHSHSHSHTHTEVRGLKFWADCVAQYRCCRSS